MTACIAESMCCQGRRGEEEHMSLCRAYVSSRFFLVVPESFCIHVITSDWEPLTHCVYVCLCIITVTRVLKVLVSKFLQTTWLLYKKKKLDTIFSDLHWRFRFLTGINCHINSKCPILTTMSSRHHNVQLWSGCPPPPPRFVTSFSTCMQSTDAYTCII